MMVDRAIDTPAVVVSKRKSIEKYQFPKRTLALASKQPKRKLPKNQTIRPPTWNPLIELSPSEQNVAKRIRKAKLFLFLRNIRHQLFDEEFQIELATSFKPVNKFRKGNQLDGKHRDEFK
jgi:hypothetical protein